MERVLKHLLSYAELVVIDTPAALMVSDPLPLMELADGVVLVARLNRSSRERIARLRRMVSAVHANLFGVVATGVSDRHGYGYYAPKEYARNGTNGAEPAHTAAEPEVLSAADPE
jgi:Mrp family chromosome partitioning ATPase